MASKEKFRRLWRQTRVRSPSASSEPAELDIHYRPAIIPKRTNTLKMLQGRRAYLIGKGKSPIGAYLGIDDHIIGKTCELTPFTPALQVPLRKSGFAEVRSGHCFIGPTAEMQRRGNKVRLKVDAAGWPLCRDKGSGLGRGRP
jgi:pyruvate carboxylase